MTHKKTCGTCRFFDDDPIEACDGTCHFNPPVFAQALDGVQAPMFIPTDKDAWCGQWEPNSEEMITAIDGLLGAIFGTKNEASNESEQKAPDPEDSWEKLREDAKKTGINYWQCSDAFCKDCPARVGDKTPKDRYHVMSCSTAMQMEILARAEKLAGVMGDE